MESEPPYQYVGGNVVNRVDPSGFTSECQDAKCKIELLSGPAAGQNFAAHYGIVHTDRIGEVKSIEAFPSLPYGDIDWKKRVTEDHNFKDIGNPAYWNPILHPYETAAGIIEASIQTRIPEDIEAIKNESLIEFVTVVEGEEACDKLECLENAMKQVEQNEIGYMLLGPNSTSAAISVLRKCQLSWWSAIGEITYKRPSRYSPGWALDLLGPLANTRDARKSTN